jgi:hypothetical protein
VGIDYDDVMQTLEDQGVTAFEASWDQMATPLREHHRIEFIQDGL